MSEEKKETTKETSGGGAATLAETYLDEQLAKAQKGLKTTQIVMGVLTLIVLGYMSFITVKLREFAEPAEAAQLAIVYGEPYVTGQLDDLIGQMDESIPQFLSQFPNQAIESLPEYRKKLLDRILLAMTEYADKTAVDLGENLDTVLDQHSESIAQLLETAEDPASAEALAKEIVGEITSVLDERGAGGESIRDKLDFSLDALKNIESHIAKLAQTTKLSDSEHKQRRLIAILMKTVDQELDRSAMNYFRSN
ncbi:MAG: hypothetical protein ACI9VS_000222 [Candidatus Binatia bacterium]|jgi:hypothetical protein